jgi:hypothetical protein
VLRLTLKPWPARQTLSTSELHPQPLVLLLINHLLQGICSFVVDCNISCFRLQVVVCADTDLVKLF